MDVRWLAYIGSGLLAAASLVPLTWQRASEARGGGVAAARAPVPVAHEDYARLLDVEQRIARLRRYRYDAPAPRAASRNPFRFGADQRILGPAPPSPPPTAPDLTPSTPIEEPLLRLVGIVERRKGDTLERTAVIAGLGDVHLVGVGGRIGDRFTVLSTSSDSVELRDERLGAVVRLVIEREP